MTTSQPQPTQATQPKTEDEKRAEAVDRFWDLELAARSPAQKAKAARGKAMIAALGKDSQ